MKDITTNARLNDSVAMLHLFDFDIYSLSGVYEETLHFTDNDIFVEFEEVEYTPLTITFNELSEDITMQSNSIDLSLDNITQQLTQIAITKEWRNNKAVIKRVIYTPPLDTIDSEIYEFGYGDNLDTYPKLTLDSITKDVYTLFTGIIDTFSATETAVNGTISTLFANWKKPYPSRTYNQNEFNTIIDTISETLYWGRTK